MKAMIHVGALGLTLHEDGEPVNGINTGPTDRLYEARCIKFDAERAAKMGEPIERACSWEKGTAQRGWWEAAYRAAGGRV